jgi:hypothetical protein
MLSLTVLVKISSHEKTTEVVPTTALSVAEAEPRELNTGAKMIEEGRIAVRGSWTRRMRPVTWLDCDAKRASRAVWRTTSLCRLYMTALTLLEMGEICHTGTRYVGYVEPVSVELA